MKAAVIIDKGQIVIKDRPMPVADGNSVIMKTTCVGVCGSDVHMWEMGDWPIYNDLVPGHEHTGIVEDPGSRTDLKKGDRITTIPVSTYCGTCEACKQGKFDLCKTKLLAPGNYHGWDGSYAEYMKAAPHMVRKIPDGMSDEECAMVEPASTPYSAVKQLGIGKGATVLISGGGIIGSLAAQWAKYFGAKYVAMTEVNDFRAQKNLKEGYVDEVFNGTDKDIVEKLRAATGGVGFDYFIECTGNNFATNAGLASCKMRGKVALVGVSFEIKPFSVYHTMLYRLNVIGILGYTAQEFEEVMNLIANKEFNVMNQYSRDIKIEEIEDTFKALKDPNCQDTKVMIKW